MSRASKTIAVTVLLVSVLGVAAPARAQTPQRLDFDSVPTAPWEVAGQVSASGGALHVGPGGDLKVGFDPLQRGEWYSSVENELGWTMSARVRLDSSLAGDCAEEWAVLTVADHTIDVWLAFGVGGICVRSGGMPALRYAMNTQDAFHTYRLDVKRQHVLLSVDGVAAVAFDAPRANSFIGAWIELLSVPGRRTHWDFLSFDTTPSLPACTIAGTAGNDVLNGTAGRDVICAGDGNDIVSGFGGDDVLIGGFGDDQLFGGIGRDVILGHEGFDFIRGDAGADTLYGGPSDDTFSASPFSDGADTMVGGDGSDTAAYGRRGTGVRVTLDGVANDGAPYEGDRVGVVRWQTVTWPDVENVTGGDAGDVIAGSVVLNVLVGGRGSDTVRGLGGDDIIDVRDRAAVDTANGGAGSDLCVADPGDAVTLCEH